MEVTDCSVAVCGLSADVTTGELYKVFSDYGTVTDCKVLVHEDDESRGRGLVTFDSARTADMMLNGRFGHIVVCKSDVTIQAVSFGDMPDTVGRTSTTRSERTQDDVGDMLPDDASELPSSTGQNQDDLALQKPKRNKWDEDDDWDEPSKEEHDVCKLFVGGLTADVDAQRLRETFASFGQVVDSGIVLNFRQKSRGYGWITMREKEEADEILTKTVKIGGYRIVIASSEGKNFDDDPEPPPKPTQPYKKPDRDYRYQAWRPDNSGVRHADGDESKKRAFASDGEPRKRNKWEEDDDLYTLTKKGGGAEDDAEMLKPNANPRREMSYCAIHDKRRSLECLKIDLATGKHICSAGNECLRSVVDLREETGLRRFHNPSLSIQDQSTVFILNLPRTVNNDRLKVIFTQFGDVVGAVIDNSGVGRVRFGGRRSALISAEKEWLEIDGEWAQIKTLDDYTGEKKGITPDESGTYSYNARASDEGDTRNFNDGNADALENMSALDKLQFANYDNIPESAALPELQLSLPVGPVDIGMVGVTGESLGIKAPDQHIDAATAAEMLEAINGVRMTKLFVGNVPKDLSTEEFSEYWNENVRGVVDCVAIFGRRIGFVTFDSEETAERVLHESHTIQGRRLNLRWNLYEARRPKAADMELMRAEGADITPPQKAKLFVGQIDHNLTAEEFKEEFEKFGEVIDHILFAHRGFGYIQFAEEQTADKVLTMQIRFHGRLATLNRVKYGRRRDRPQDIPRVSRNMWSDN